MTSPNPIEPESERFEQAGALGEPDVVNLAAAQARKQDLVPHRIVPRRNEDTESGAPCARLG